MINFTLITVEINETNLKREVDTNQNLFGINRIRQFYGSPHIEIDDILLRGPAMSDNIPLIELYNETECEDYETMFKFPEVREFVANVFVKVNANKLGRVMITRLKPGGKIKPHTDEGEVPKLYNRYHYVIQGDVGNLFIIYGQIKQMLTGQLWRVDVSKEHSIINESSSDQIHLIMDMI